MQPRRPDQGVPTAAAMAASRAAESRRGGGEAVAEDSSGGGGAATPSSGRVRPTPLVLHVAAVEYTVRFLLLPQLTALQERGYRVKVACALAAPEPSPDLAPFSPIDAGFPRSLKPAAMARACFRLARIIRAVEPDLVHLHSVAAALPARCIPRRMLPPRTRIVYTVHGFAHQWDSGARRDRLLARVEQVLASRTDLLLFQSHEDFAQARLHQFPTILRYLGNGIGDEWFADPVQPAPRRPLRAIFVGRLVREKGLLDLLDAVEQVADVHLAIAGEQLPSERDGVEAVVRRRAAEPPLRGRVELLGVLDSASLRRQIISSHVMVLPSYREGVPRSLIEGLASGRPAIATDIRGCRELIAHGRNGWLIAAGDVAALTAALRSIRDLDPVRFTAACREARASVSERHRERFVIERLVDAYAEVGVSPPSDRSADRPRTR